MTLAMGLGIPCGQQGGDVLTIAFTGGTANNITLLRITTGACVMRSTGGITISSTEGGTYTNSLALSAAANSIYIKTDGNNGAIYLPSGTITKWGVSTLSTGGGYKYQSGGSAAGVPDIAVDMNNLSPACTLICQYIAAKTSTFIGELPVGLQSLSLHDNDTYFNFTKLPSGLTFLYILSGNVTLTSSDALPVGILTLNLTGAKINWTGLTVSGTEVITTFTLANYRQTNYLTGANLLTLLTSMATRTGGANGSFTASMTCTIKEYANDGAAGDENAISPTVTVINASTLQATYAECTTLAQQIHFRIHEVQALVTPNLTLAISKT